MIKVAETKEIWLYVCKCFYLSRKLLTLHAEKKNLKAVIHIEIKGVFLDPARFSSEVCFLNQAGRVWSSQLLVQLISGPC